MWSGGGGGSEELLKWGGCQTEHVATGMVFLSLMSRRDEWLENTSEHSGEVKPCFFFASDMHRIPGIVKYLVSGFVSCLL